VCGSTSVVGRHATLDEAAVVTPAGFEPAASRLGI
jgi:hypothetical protein